MSGLYHVVKIMDFSNCLFHYQLLWESITGFSEAQGPKEFALLVDNSYIPA